MKRAIPRSYLLMKIDNSASQAQRENFHKLLTAMRARSTASKGKRYPWRQAGLNELLED
jgi:hypothetical protein